MHTVKISPHHGERSASLLRKRLTATHPRLRERLVALAFIAEGLPAKVVAPRLGRHRGTVESWVQRFNAHGLTGLLPKLRGQPGTVLSMAELTQLRDVVQRPPRRVGLQTGTWSANVVVAYVKRPFGKTISSATARRYLHQWGFRRKRPRKRFTKADPEAQQAFAQALAHIEQQREPGRVTVDMDQGHIWPDALPRLGWFARGQPAWIDSTSPRTRDKLRFDVAVVRPLGRVITRLWAGFTPETTAQFLAKVRRGLRGVRIDLVMDHAPHHQGTIVEEALARGRMIAHRVPPYSPQMNAAEPWIGWAKAVLSANTCWQDHGTLGRSCIGCVASMTKRPRGGLRRCVPDRLGFKCA
jgi:transposase